MKSIAATVILAFALAAGPAMAGRLELRFGYEVLDISDFDEPDVIWLTGAWRF